MTYPPDWPDSQMDLALPRTCPVRSVPFADGHGSVRRHECGNYAVNIWPCYDCDDHPGDLSVPAVRAEIARMTREEGT